MIIKKIRRWRGKRRAKKLSKATQMLGMCRDCGKEINKDTHICPHCNTVLIEYMEEK